MTLKTQMASDSSIFFNTDEFSDTISYTPKGGAATDVSAIVDRTAFGQEPYVRGTETATCIVTVRAGEVANPQRGDVFTFGGDNWELDPGEGVIQDDGYVFEISLRRID